MTDQIPPRLAERMERIARLIRLPAQQKQMYEEVLTAEERQLLHEDLPELLEEMRDKRESDDRPFTTPTVDAQICGNGFRNICRIAEHRALAPEKLVINLAREFGFLQGEAEYQQLLFHFCGEDTASPSAQISYAEGELRLNGRLVRRVKRYNKKSNVEIVLESFQETGWREQRMDFSNFKRLRDKIGETVNSLNQNLTGIRFRSSAAGKEIYWELVEEI